MLPRLALFLRHANELGSGEMSLLALVHGEVVEGLPVGNRGRGHGEGMPPDMLNIEGN